MKEKKAGYFRQDTGEMVDDLPVIFSKKVENGFDEFITMTQDFLDLLTDKETSLTRLKVLLCLVKYTDYQNLIFAKQKDMAEAIKTSVTDFSRAMKFWREKGMIQRDNTKNAWQLSPEYFWKGDGRTHKKLLETMRRQRTAQAKSRTLH